MILGSFAVFGAPPAWWTERGVLNGNPSDDYAAANIGQLKHIASKAAAELNAKLLPDGAGEEINNLVASWSAAPAAGVSRDDYAAVNLGQLKAVAKPFYDRLIAAGYTDAYPWGNSLQPTNDYAAANLGQLKNLFSFDPGLDTDTDHLADWWEIRHFGNLGRSGQGDFNSDGVTDFQESQQGSSPTRSDSDGDGTPNSEDAYPLDPLRTIDLPTRQYVVVSIGAPPNSLLGAIDDLNQISYGVSASGTLFQTVCWKEGVAQPPTSYVLPSARIYYGDDVYGPEVFSNVSSINSWGEIAGSQPNAIFETRSAFVHYGSALEDLGGTDMFYNASSVQLGNLRGFTGNQSGTAHFVGFSTTTKWFPDEFGHTYFPYVQSMSGLLSAGLHDGVAVIMGANGSVQRYLGNVAPVAVNDTGLCLTIRAEFEVDGIDLNAQLPGDVRQQIKCDGNWGRLNNSGDVTFTGHSLEGSGRGEWTPAIFLWQRAENKVVKILLPLPNLLDATQFNNHRIFAARHSNTPVLLLPVELLVKDPSNPSVKKTTDKLQIATLESAFGGSDYHALANFMEADLQSFYFRMKNPAKTGAGKMKIRISTDSEGTEYDDPAHEVELIETPANSGDFISPAQILVSNEIDDVKEFTFDGTVIGDEALNDRTHRIALGGKLIVEVDPLGGTNYQRMEMATVPVEKTVKVKPIVLKAGSIFNTAVISDAEVAEDMKTLRETFAQCGIKITDAAIAYLDEDDIPDFDLTSGINGLATNGDASNLTVEEQRLFQVIAVDRMRAEDEVSIIYVNTLHENGPPWNPIKGQAYIEKKAPVPSATYANHVVLSANRGKFVAPHELLHVLLDATHPPGPNDYPTEFAHQRMTWSGGPNDAGFSSRKRVTKHTAGRQAVKAQQSRFAK